MEFGTTGLGVNLSYPIITDRLIVSMGYNFPTLSINETIDLNMKGKLIEASEMSKEYNQMRDLALMIFPEDEVNKKFPLIQEIEPKEECQTKIKDILNFSNFKLMLEYYPTNSSYFHFTAGVMIGNGEWMSISAQADPEVWKVYEDAVKANNIYKEIQQTMKDDYGIDITPVENLENIAKVNVGKDTYHLKAESGGRLDTKLTIKKVKPYIGIGFGSSIPTKRRLGFQMEIGAYYQGKPTFEGATKPEENYDASAFNNRLVDEIVDDLVYLRWYPQLSFRFTGRIF